jgi:uncharacterized membrane protein
VHPVSFRTRRPFIDWARGLAVLLMIEAHTLDAWTRASSRTSRAFAYGGILGGFAAPAFLWLAGLGVALSAGRLARRGENTAVIVETLVRRGLEIFILAFLFRLQAFVVSPGSYPVTLFRVDILNVMGPSMVLAALVWGAAGESAARRVFVFAALASAWAMVTPIVRLAALPDWLPLWMQWYIQPAGDYTTFTLFPWAGFVLAGAGCGVLLEAARDWRVERRTLVWFAGMGLIAVALGFVTAARPSIYAESFFWTSSPAFFSIRVGILMIALVILAGAERLLERVHIEGRLLSRFGRASLFVYWIHVELVYGYATWGLHRRLPLWGTAIMFVLFCVAMYGAIVLRDRLIQAWHARQQFSSNAGVSAAVTE